MTKSLPPEPSFKFLKLEAKSILKAHRNRDPAVCTLLRRLHHLANPSDLQILDTPIGLQEVQFALSMEYGFKNWTELKKYVANEEMKMVKYDNLTMPTYSTTLMSVIKGVADYYQIPLSDPMLYGLSGHAFVINIHRDICPSGPYIWNHSGFFRLVKNLGIATEELGFFDPSSSSAKRAHAEEKLRLAIDAKFPCSFCNMEHQLIKGYDQDGLLLLRPWPDCGTEEMTPSRITFGSWRELKEVHACFYIHEKVSAIDAKQALRESLQYAVDLFTTSAEFGWGDYGMGTEAYAKWIAGVPKFSAEHGNWWNAMVWSECRKMASAFFAEIAVKYPQLAGECVQLTGLYGNISEALFKVGDKQMNPQEKVILLETALQKELEAVELIKAILNVLAEPAT